MNLMAEEVFSHQEKKSLLSMPENLEGIGIEEIEATAREIDHATEKEAEDHLQETNVSSAAKQATGPENVQSEETMTEVEVVKEEATETVDQEKETMLEEREGASLVEVKDILLETVERIKETIPEIEEEKGVEAENQLGLGFPSALLLATPHHGPRARSKKIEMIDMKELLTESTKVEVANVEDREAILTLDQDLDPIAIHTILEIKNTPQREVAKEVEADEEAEPLIQETKREESPTQKTQDLDPIHTQKDPFQDLQEVKLLGMRRKD